EQPLLACDQGTARRGAGREQERRADQCGNAGFAGANHVDSRHEGGCKSSDRTRNGRAVENVSRPDLQRGFEPQPGACDRAGVVYSPIETSSEPLRSNASSSRVSAIERIAARWLSSPPSSSTMPSKVSRSLRSLT